MKTKRLFKKVTGIILSIILLATIALPAVSASSGDERQDSRTAYINKVLPNYLAIEYTGEYESVQISQGFKVRGNADENSRTFFVTGDGKLIGCLVVTSVDGQYQSGFYFEDNADITRAINNGTPIELLVIDDKLVMKTEDLLIAVSSGVEFVNDSRSSKINYELEYIVLNSVGFDTATIALYASPQRGSDTPINLKVTRVANASVNNIGICWAACIAAVSNYKKSTSYTALNVYNALDKTYDYTPYGDEPWYTRGFDSCGLPTPTVVIGSLSYSSSRSVLSSDKPIIMSIANKTVGHDLVIKYLWMNDNGIDYIYTWGFMDPNISSTVYIDVYNKTSFSLYVSDVHTLTSWHRSVY